MNGDLKEKNNRASKTSNRAYCHLKSDGRSGPPSLCHHHNSQVKELKQHGLKDKVQLFYLSLYY